jgi:polyglutamine-binding protein 1
MDNYQNQPLPPGVETWPQSLPNHPPQFDAGSHPYPPPFDTTPGIGNVSGNGNTTDIESAVQEAVLHAQVLISFRLHSIKCSYIAISW